jgi:hypothetical protein
MSVLVLVLVLIDCRPRPVRSFHLFSILKNGDGEWVGAFDGNATQRNATGINENLWVLRISQELSDLDFCFLRRGLEEKGEMSEL